MQRQDSRLDSQPEHQQPEDPGLFVDMSWFGGINGGLKRQFAEANPPLPVTDRAIHGQSQQREHHGNTAGQGVKHKTFGRYRRIAIAPS